ncbi:hypothetical protein PHLGIDRAFT_119556 [Phlebiopsis gigantea 11061_1 CR5-6]|uniref:Uncharacterized protein n=1 Tax=Phlebiopsis gigantea (strain 11061_1 CR5-6) TaxID=745531 RepID=A0A0C3S5P3_PHLG1|nr:hypothetical protein PHLGIDRAFT_119556 [Phlebiopsis gigantea 11061_1 CR5-6]
MTSQLSATLSNSLPKVNVNSTLGAILIGEVLVAILFGITSIQTYLYFHYSWKFEDSWRLKTVIAVLWLINAVYLAFTTGTVYDYCITNFTNLWELTQFSWFFAGTLGCGVEIQFGFCAALFTS